MTTITIEGAKCTVSAAIAATYLHEHNAVLKAQARQARRLAEERELFAALQAAKAAGDWSLYSDLYKDLYGIRP